jgi:hypothetical protein
MGISQSVLSDCRSGHSFEDDIHDLLRRGNQRRVIDGVRANLRAHASSHKMLRLRIDHAVFFRHQEPRGLRLPSRLRRSFLNAWQSNRPLRGSQYCNHVGGSILRERISKAVFRHPNEAVGVGRQLRGLGVWLSSIKHFTDGFTLVGRQRRDVDQRFYPLIFTAEMTAPA